MGRCLFLLSVRVLLRVDVGVTCFALLLYRLCLLDILVRVGLVALPNVLGTNAATRTTLNDVLDGCGMSAMMSFISRRRCC